MQQAAQSSGDLSGNSTLAGRTADPDSIAPAFANLLSALATAGQESLPSWDDAELADDVATLSYERALQASARYRRRELDDRSLTQPATARRGQGKAATQDPGDHNGDLAGAQPSLKSASITIRMSHAECENLRQRAAEAELTVSAYLRSCAFEVESLRAQVKEAVAQLRPAPQPVSADDPGPARLSWLRRVISR